MSGQPWLFQHQSVSLCQVAAACHNVMRHGLHFQPIMLMKVLVAAALICPVDALFCACCLVTTIISYQLIFIKQSSNMKKWS